MCTSNFGAELWRKRWMNYIKSWSPYCTRNICFWNKSFSFEAIFTALQWRHNEHDGVSNPEPRDCLFSRYSRRKSKKTSKLRVTDLCKGNSPVTGEFHAQRASNAENVSTRWRHHDVQNIMALVLVLFSHYVYVFCHVNGFADRHMVTARGESITTQYMISNDSYNVIWLCN